jgi:HlyD family secretion protein
VEEGSSVIERNNFNEGTSIAVVADMNALVFEGKVDESDVGKLKEGMPLLLTVGAIQNRQFDATLEFISPKGTDEEGTVKFELRAAVKPTEDIFLRAGYSANADIILDKREEVLSIKERDVLFEEDTTYVEVQTGDREFEKKAVQLGLSDGIQVEVLGGLDAESKVKVQTKAQEG